MPPASGRSKRTMSAPTWILPEPLSPTTPSVSPRRTAMSTRSTAVTRRAGRNSRTCRTIGLRQAFASEDNRLRPSVWAYVPRAGAALRRSAPGYKDAPVRRAPRRARPSSTLRPCRITATRSAISATTPKSCVMNSMPICVAAGSAFSRRRICICVVTSSAVVGSSAISRSGRKRQRHRDHYSLALAAR